MKTDLSLPFAILSKLIIFQVTQTSRAGAAFVVLFGLAFAGFGLFAASAFFFSAPTAVHGNRIAAVLGSCAFILIGFGLIFGAIYGNRKLKEQAAIERANPGSPWLWRTDWATSRAESKNRGNVIGLWLVAIFSNAILIPIAAGNAPKLLHDSDPGVFLLFGFCLIGLILLMAAIRASIRRQRFGKTYFEFASLPFSPGHSLKGTIHLRFNTTATHGIALRLSCVRQVITGAGNNRTTNQSVLWQDDRTVPAQSLMPGPMGDATIPVDFTIPADAYETNHDQPRDQVLWLLHAQADVPGIDYSEDFEVPVFRLTPVDSSSPATASFSRSAPSQNDTSDVSAPDNPKVLISTGTTGGTEFCFPAFRNPARTLVLMLVTAGWTAGVYALQHSKAPWFAGVFGLFDVLLIYGVLQSALAGARIEIGNGKIRIQRTMLGIGSTREIPLSEVSSIIPVTALQQGTNATYFIRLQTTNGKKLTLVDAIDNRQEARWVVAQMEKLAGFKLDTRVAVDTGLVDCGPPPQRGQAPVTASRRRNSPIATAIGCAIFVAWSAFIGSRFFSTTRNLPKRVPSAKSAIQRIAYSPLTDEDMQRVQSLPAQVQAEELLERAIQHDPRALEMFDQKCESWIGYIHKTSRMQQLEQRSRFSTDLRVRQANADINLALDGWAKNDQSADMLLDRAQTDPQYRAAAVYFMGMLAGRGVAYDRLYPVLLSYAKNDPDATVRQWAVEGMRYLGTDEALDQLFDSFTSDPSNPVRDRAGCNISDCGNFMRKQRMHMVPKFIALTQDSSTTPQMKNWAFLALHEITDENLPADSTAWSNWYDQHGAEKQTEFNALDWWRVRGDE